MITDTLVYCENCPCFQSQDQEFCNLGYEVTKQFDHFDKSLKIPIFVSASSTCQLVEIKMLDKTFVPEVFHPDLGDSSKWMSYIQRVDPLLRQWGTVHDE